MYISTGPSPLVSLACIYTYTQTCTPTNPPTQSKSNPQVALATFLVRVKVERKPLDPAAAFAALALFNLLRFPLIAMPEALHHAIQVINKGRCCAYHLNSCAHKHAIRLIRVGVA